MAEKTIKYIIDDIFNENLNPFRKMMERLWFRNILYYIGEQYIDFMVSDQTFRRRNINPFIPTPVDNIIREYVRSTKALILNKEYTVTVWPNSNEQKDREGALAGQDIINHMDGLNDEAFADEKEKVVLWMLLTGLGLMRTFPKKQNDDFMLSKGKNIIRPGEVVSENFFCFNLHIDNIGDSLRSKRYIGMKTLKPREWVEDTFHIKVKDKDDPNVINYQSRLMKLMTEVSPWKGAGLQSQILSLKDEDLVIYKEVEFQPTEKKPEGRYVASCGGEIVIDIDAMPIPVEKGQWYYTLTDFHYNYVPGRFWSDAGVNDLISPQNTINSIDQDAEINRKGLGQPWVGLPQNANLKRVDKWGQMLKVIEYDLNASGGMKPEINHGVPLPDQFFKARQTARESAQDASGDPKNVLKGQAPTAKASGVMVDILKETAEASHTPDIKRVYRSFQRVYRKRLILAKLLYTEKRKIKIMGEGNQIRVRNFQASDLRDNTDVRLELSSGIVSSSAAQTNMITNLVQTGMFGDLSQDPDTKNEILTRLGLSGFENKTSVDVERAEEENMRILAAKPTDKADKIEGIFLTMVNEETGEEEVINDDPYFKYDNHQIHFETHRRFIISKEFKTLPMKSQTVLIAHTDIHHKLYQAELQRQMKQQIMMEQAIRGGGQENQGWQGEGAQE